MSLMKNVKLFLKSLFNNNAAIDAARKKPWYAAIIIFLLSMVISVVPSTVLELQNHGDKKFDSNTYYAAEALTQFSKDLKDNDVKFEVVDGRLNAQPEYVFNFVDDAHPEKTYYRFEYTTNANLESKRENYNKENISYFLFTSDDLYIHIVNPSNPDGSNPVFTLPCANAYKKVSRDEIKNALVENADKTTQMESTWANWKGLIRKFYNQSRLRYAGSKLLVAAIINVVISLIMGFMTWILTRGKNNPYRSFSVWDCFKISFWAGMFPAMLTCGFGFLIKNLASTLFPLLLGVRSMWLSMKSLRPDGSGYAAN